MHIMFIGAPIPISPPETLPTPQATFFKTPCPTERGACLEITLVSEGERGGCNTASPDTEATAISLYAVQAPHRPLRLSSYQWVSRGKAYHRLVLHWKGGLACPSQRSGDRVPGYHGTATRVSLSHTVIPPPWGGVTGHRPPNATDVCASALMTSPAPIHVAVVCPEAPPPLAVPVAPAFDGSTGDLLAEQGQAERDARQKGVGTGVDSKANLALQGVPGGGRKTWVDAREAERERGTAAGRRSRRVRFYVAVRVLGPPRVVLEGR